MNDDKLLEQLSAHLDGEAELPEAVAQRLQDDPALAARVQQWQRLSSALKDLPRPEPHPAFARRVVAHAEEQHQKHHRPALVFGTPLALVTTVVCVLSGVYLFQQPAQEHTDYQSLVRQAQSYQDDDAVVAALADLLDQGADLSYFSDVDDDVNASWESVTVDEWVGALTENTVTSYDTNSDAWGLDVYGSWETLTEEETRYLLNSAS